MGNSSSYPRREANGIRIAIVGDVHGAWDKVADEKALRFLDPDVVLFVGDFGDGDVNLVESVSLLDMPKAAILGNHDCFGAGPSNRLKQLFDSTVIKNTHQNEGCPVKQQLQALGDCHVGFGRKDFPDLKISVVGSRPFSSGGEHIFNAEDCASLYNVRSMQESADTITSCGMGAPRDHLLVFLGHNGPKGLGSQQHDICGMDFTKDGGDHGDSDLQEAIRRCSATYSVPLVAFGHSHRSIAADGQVRKMVKCGDNGTVYVNAAVVPRQRHGSRQRNFTLVELIDGKVSKVAETWVNVSFLGIVSLTEEVLLYSD